MINFQNVCFEENNKNESISPVGCNLLIDIWWLCRTLICPKRYNQVWIIVVYLRKKRAWWNIVISVKKIIYLLQKYSKFFVFIRQDINIVLYYSSNYVNNFFQKKLGQFMPHVANRTLNNKIFSKIMDNI